MNTAAMWGVALFAVLAVMSEVVLAAGQRKMLMLNTAPALPTLAGVQAGLGTFMANAGGMINGAMLGVQQTAMGALAPVLAVCF